MPSVDWTFPTMSLFSTASMTYFSWTAFWACIWAPMRPCSSPARAMKTSVASKSIPLSPNTRASSITSAVPLPSSFTPGAVLSTGGAGAADWVEGAACPAGGAPAAAEGGRALLLDAPAPAPAAGRAGEGGRANES